MDYLDLAEYLALASRVLDLDIRTLRKASRLNEADSALHAPAAGFGETDLYPDLATKAGILGYRLVMNHPLPDGNKRSAFVAMVMFLRRNGHNWTHDSDVGEVVDTMVAVAAGVMSEDAFVDWVTAHVTRLT